jgi:predicted negative regulator of RcsB-dependent stress response
MSKNSIVLVFQLPLIRNFFYRFFLLFTVYFSVIAVNCAAQTNPELQRAYTEIRELRINSGRQILAKEKAKKIPSDGFDIYLENYADIVSLLVSDDVALYTQLIDREEEMLGLLKKLSDKTPQKRFFMAEVRLHWAFVKLKFGKEYSASWDIIKAFKLLEENATMFPSFLPTYKSLGLLHVLIGSTPQNYKWVADLLGLRGNIQQGLREIQMVIQKDTLFKTEAQLIQLLIQANILKYSEKNNVDLLALVRAQPDDLLLHFFGTIISMKDGRGEQALKMLDSCPKGSQYYTFPFLDFLKGQLLLEKSQYTEAEKYFKTFLNRYQGQNFVKEANFKLYLCNWLINNELILKYYVNNILKTGQTVVESDKAAQKFAENYKKSPHGEPQKILMKARLAFDGGFLDEALKDLEAYNENSFSQLPDRAEYQYRLGRIFQKNNQPDRAIVVYERSLILSEPQALYFGANSALQLGYIYQLKNQRQRAIMYFQKALNYPKHEYKNSIDNKAKAALTALGV